MPSVMNQLLVKIITLFGFVLSAFLAFNALQLSSYSSDDNGIEILNTENNHSLSVVKIVSRQQKVN
jgi:hypothetical protein